jgi:hypothetical protein
MSIKHYKYRYRTYRIYNIDIYKEIYITSIGI